MARTMKDASLATRTARARLAPRKRPYWRLLEAGRHLGYYRGARTGRWIARLTRDGRYLERTLGTADDAHDADGVDVLTFDQAQAAARAWFAEQARASVAAPEASGPYSVRDAIADYLAWLDEHRKSAVDARYRAQVLILPSLGKLEVAALTTIRLREWLNAVAKAPARVRTRKRQPQRHRDLDPGDAEAVRRRRASANRVCTILKAALNRAWREGKVASDAAWRRVQPFRGVDAARLRYLTLEECRRLRNAASPSFRRLVEAALLTGCRYGELAALEVRDWHGDAGTVHVRTSKSGTGRHVVLTDEGVAFFRSITAGRPGSAPMLAKEDGGRWGPSQQRRPLLEACRGASLDPPADFHALRHTYASLAVMNGTPLMVVARNLGHADTRMVERHYGHLAPSYIRDAIRKGVPSFGIKADDQVVPIEAAR